MAKIYPVYPPTTLSFEEKSRGSGSIFLAGPTPRSPNVKSWRPDFLKILDSYDIECSVYIPERYAGDYVQQCEWELEYLMSATAIAFWIPRELNTMPAFTTNVEFGYWVKSKKVFYGRPDNAPKTKYLDWLYSKHNLDSPFNSINKLVDAVYNYVKGF